MSRIGKQPIPVADSIEFSIDADNLITLKGKKGSDSLRLHLDITVEKSNGEIVVIRSSECKDNRSLHGLYRTLIYNMVTGVDGGFEEQFEVIGVGYRDTMNGNVLELSLGFYHPVYFVPPDEITIEVDTKSRKNPVIKISGINKELVGQVAAKIRSFRKPEPYKGKGIRYIDEHVRRKAGKSAAK